MCSEGNIYIWLRYIYIYIYSICICIRILKEKEYLNACDNAGNSNGSHYTQHALYSSVLLTVL